MPDSNDDDKLMDAIVENATGPKSAQGDGQSMQQHSLQDQIAADRYRRQVAASSQPFGGVRRVRLIPPNAL